MRKGSSLFREEAIEAQRAPEFGAPISAMPMSWRVLVWFVSILFTSAVAFITTQTITRRETARGILVLSLGELRVVPARSGMLTALYVKDGDSVVAGQGLAYISTVQYSVGGDAVQTQLLGAIAEQRSALAAELAALDASAPTEKLGQERRVAAEKNKLRELMQSLPRKRDRLHLAEDTYEQGEQFRARGALSGDVLRQRQYDWLTQQSEIQTLKAEIEELRGTVAHDEAALTELPELQAKQRAELLHQLAELREREISITGQEGYVIAARVAGRVTAVQGSVGQFVGPARPLMALTPEGSRLQAELYVPSKAIAFARKGQRVRLLYDALPYEEFGVAYGTVSDISATVLKPSEINAAVPIKEPAYRLIVDPDRLFVQAYGANVPLRSGMALSADIVLENRTFLHLMLEPILAARGRVLGEGQ